MSPLLPRAAVTLVAALMTTFLVAPVAVAGPGDRDPAFGTVLQGGTTVGRTEIGGLADVQTGDIQFGPGGGSTLSASQGNLWLLAALDASGQPAGPVNAISMPGTTSPPLITRDRDGWIQAGGTGSTWTLVRRSTAGTADTTFGTRTETFGGATLTDVRVRGVLRQHIDDEEGGRDRIVIVGDAASPGGRRTLVAGYLPSGLPDPTFSTTVTGDVPTVGGAAIDGLGRIVVGGSNGTPGTSSSGLRVLRLSPNGVRDAGFGANGLATHAFPVDFAPARVEGVAIASGNRPVLVGTERYNAYSDGAFMVARLTDVGALDDTFGVGAFDGFQGITFWDFGAAWMGQAYGLAVHVQADDKIIVAGNTISQDGSETNIAIARLKPDGALDATGFGLGGQTLGFTGYGEAIAFQADGKLLVGAEDGDALVAQRYDMEPVDNSEIPPPGAAVAIEAGAAKVVDVNDRAVKLLITQADDLVTFEERRDGLELVATPGGGCTQVSAVKVTCEAAAAIDLDLKNYNDRVVVDPSVVLPVGGDLGQGNDVFQAGWTGGDLHAGEGDDVLTGGPGRDRFFGEGGNDVLDGAGGDDDLYGEGAGDCGCIAGGDTLTGGPGADRLYAGGGNDTLDAGTGDDLVEGHTGADSITAGADLDTLSLDGAEGATRVRADGVANDGALDTDAATAGLQPEGDAVAADFEAVFGSDQADDVEIPAAAAGFGRATSFGGDGDDRIVGSEGRDEIFGGLGHDVLDGRAGTDRLFGSSLLGSDDVAEDSDDELYGGEGDSDLLVGGNGSDKLDGGPGDEDALFSEFETDEAGSTVDGDTLIGGLGERDRAVLGRSGDQSVTLDGVANDGRDDEFDDVRSDIEYVVTGSGDDTVVGDDSNETFVLYEGADVVDGGGGSDNLFGDEGEDTLRGGPGPDTLYGGYDNAADALDGGSEDDILSGGGGDDELVGGAGRDRVFGEEGADTLRVRDNEVELQLSCGAGADVAVLDADDPAADECETQQRSGVTPTPTPAPPTPGPTPIGTPGPLPGPDDNAPPAPSPDEAPVCPTRVDLFVRGTVPADLGLRDGFALNVDSVRRSVTIDGSLLDAASGEVLATGRIAPDAFSDPMRFTVAAGAAAKLGAADTRVAVRIVVSEAGCTPAIGTDELTIVRAGAGGKKTRLQGQVTASPAKSDPLATRARNDWSPFPNEDTAVFCWFGKGPSWDARCKPYFDGGGPGPNPDAKCEGSVSIGAVTVRGSCLKRDPKTGVYATSASFKMNGIDFTPGAGSEVRFDPSKVKLTVKGRVRLLVAGVTIYEGSPTWSLAGQDITLAKGQYAKTANIKGFALAGSVSFDITAAGATGKFMLKLPTPKKPRGAKSADLTAKAEVKFDVVKGASLEGLEIVVPPFSVGPLDVLPVRIKYVGKTDTWSGTGEAMLPGPVKPKPKVKVTFEFQKGSLRKGSLTFDDINRPLPFGPATGVVFLQKVGAGFEFEKALKVNGALALSAGPKLKLGRGAPKSILLADLTASYDFEGAGTWSGGGTITAMGEDLGEGKVEYSNGGKLSFEGKLERDFGGMKIKGSLKGQYADQAITAEGKASVSAGLLSAAGTAKLTKQTLVGCLDGFPGAGGTYVLATGEVKLFQGCGNPTLTDAVKKAKEVYDKQQAAKGKAKKSQAGSPVAVGEFLVDRGLPHVVLVVEGQGGVPQGALVSPAGERLAAPAPGQASQSGGRAILSDPASNRVFYAITNPVAGTWKWEAAAGAPALAAALQSDGVARPSIQAKVTGKGASRTLAYEVDAEDGVSVRFEEEGRDVLETLGAAQADGRGEIRFKPAEGTVGRRTIMAVVEQEGVLVDRFQVATFRVSVDGVPGRASDLRLARAGDTGLRVRFDGADGADGHRVVVGLADGRTQLVELDGGARSVVVDDVPRDVSATVTVQGVSDEGRAGAAVSKRIAAGRPLADPKLRVPSDGELGDVVVIYR